MSSAALFDRESDLRLLLLEDSTSDNELVMSLLRGQLPHAQVDVAGSLEDALAHLHRLRYDATLADLSFLHADGLTVVHTLRAAHPDTALLVLAARADGELDLWALAEGAQDYLVKGEDDGPRLATALLHALQRQQAKQEGHRDLQLARGLLDALEAPTCAVGSGGEIVAVNEAWRRFMTSNGGTSDLCSEGSDYLLACEAGATDPTDSLTPIEVGYGLRGILARRLERFDYEYCCRSPGLERWFSVRIARAEIDGTSGAVVSHVDVTAMHHVQQALSHQALHDALTGLPNRLLLTDRLNHALVECERSGREVGVVFLDLDHFKRINDSLGHRLGDELLVQVAERLRGHIRGSDTLSRYSGDEFVVVWRDLAAEVDATILSDRLAESLREPFLLGTTTVSVTASLGVVVGRPPQSADSLLLAADAAMYDAKRHGRGRVRLFSDELRRGAHERMTTEVALRHALTRSQLLLHYQPVIDLTTGLPIAVEALARWQHPERGLLAPDQFIPVAESSGLIIPLDRWALEQACFDAVSLRDAAENLNVAVNLSVRQLTQPDVARHVREALARSGLDPERLMLEVTESAVMEDEEAAAINLEALSQLGVGLAIDDFGTGYSSLLYLRRYPISAIKLDRAFVSGIPINRDDEAICGSVVSLAHAVGATSIAEGVETMEQYAALRECGCQQAQGFLWSPAVPIADLPAVLLRCGDVRAPAPAAHVPAQAGAKTSHAKPMSPR